MLKKLKLNGSMKTYKTFRTNTQKRCPFHYRGLEYKSRKSRNTWTNRQSWPWNKEWSRAEANRVLPRKCTDHSKHPLPTTQEKPLHMDTREASTHGHHQMVNTKIRLMIFFAVKHGEIMRIVINSRHFKTNWYQLPHIFWRMRHYVLGWIIGILSLNLNLVIRSSWSESQSAPGLVFVDYRELLHLWLQRIQSIWFWFWPSAHV